MQQLLEMDQDRVAREELPGELLPARSDGLKARRASLLVVPGAVLERFGSGNFTGKCFNAKRFVSN